MLHPAQIAAFRKMTPGKKLELAARLWTEARQLKAAALRQQHPDWSEEEVERAVYEVFLYAWT